MKILKKREGVTLIELIIATAIFGIIAMVFISMFFASLIWTFRAGDRGLAYTNALSKLENEMSEAGDNSDYLNLTFVEGSDSIDIEIQGRIIESSETEKQINSELDTFLPQMPRIKLDPTFRQEGDINELVTVIGFDTSFNSSTKVDIYDSSGINLISGGIVPTINSLTELKFSLPLNFINNEYIVVVKTTINGKPDEIARTKYIVEQAKFVILGKDNLYVSADGMNWLKRSTDTGWINSNSTDAIFSSYNGTNAKSVSSDGKTYIISQDSNLLLSNYNNIWSVKEQSGFNDLVWASQYFEYYASSNNGVYASSDRESWNLIYPTDKPIRAITHGIKDSITQVMAAVGDDGIFVFYNGDFWSTYKIDTGINFKSISISDSGLILALGMRGGESEIWTASIPSIGSTLTWSQVNPETYNSAVLNDVYFSSALTKFVAVGDAGTILTSSSAGTWEPLSITGLGVTNLRGVFSNLSDIVIVGDSGKIVNYKNDTGWLVINGTGITEDLLNVSGR